VDEIATCHQEDHECLPHNGLDIGEDGEPDTRPGRDVLKPGNPGGPDPACELHLVDLLANHDEENTGQTDTSGDKHLLERKSTVPRLSSRSAGSYAPYLFAVGLVAAAFLALVVISLASSWAIVEAMGWQKSSFFWVYLAESLPAVVVPIFYPHPLSLVLNLMVAFVFVLAGPGILMGLLTSNRKVMGSLVSNRRWKIAYWLSLAAVLSFGIVAVAALV
jgi:Mn2+/Fe2+ NRAMP family transporter